LELVSKTNEKFTAKLDASDSTRDQIYAAANETGTTIKLEPASSGWGWLLLINALPFLLLMGFLAFTLRQMQAGGNKASASASQKRNFSIISKNALRLRMSLESKKPKTNCRKLSNF
jgi:ATP-dependent Zn protease